jgi:hypothetical protein
MVNREHALQAKLAAPAHFPSVDNDTQKQLDQTRIVILLYELATERAALSAANSLCRSEAEIAMISNTNGVTRTFSNTP